MNDGPKFEIVHLLGQRGVPFAFVTGAEAIAAGLADVARLQKPIPLRDMVRQWAACRVEMFTCEVDLAPCEA